MQGSDVIDSAIVTLKLPAQNARCRLTDWPLCLGPAEGVALSMGGPPVSELAMLWALALLLTPLLSCVQASRELHMCTNMSSNKSCNIYDVETKK